MASTPSPPYQDLRRAVGYLLDHEGWRDVALAAARDGLTVRGRRPTGLGLAEVEVRLTLADLMRLRREARGRRGWVAPAGPAAGGGPGYQARLRAVGWLGEVAGLRELRVVEAGDDLLVQGWPAGAAEAGGRRSVQQRLTPADIAGLLHQLARIGRRNASRPRGE